VASLVAPPNFSGRFSGADFFGSFSAFLSLLAITLVIPAQLGKPQFFTVSPCVPQRWHRAAGLA